MYSPLRFALLSCSSLALVATGLWLGLRTPALELRFSHYLSDDRRMPVFQVVNRTTELWTAFHIIGCTGMQQEIGPGQTVDLDGFCLEPDDRNRVELRLWPCSEREMYAPSKSRSGWFRRIFPEHVTLRCPMPGDYVAFVAEEIDFPPEEGDTSTPAIPGL